MFFLHILKKNVVYVSRKSYVHRKKHSPTILIIMQAEVGIDMPAAKLFSTFLLPCLTVWLLRIRNARPTVFYVRWVGRMPIATRFHHDSQWTHWTLAVRQWDLLGAVGVRCTIDSALHHRFHYKPSLKGPIHLQ